MTDGRWHSRSFGIANAYNTIVPGHVHLRWLAERVHEGIAAAGGVPFEFGVIGICDGIAMGHEGMRYSLPSRENIADSIELMVQAHRFDGLVCIGTCGWMVAGNAYGDCTMQYSFDYPYRGSDALRAIRQKRPFTD